MKISIFIALIITILVSIWVLSGVFNPEKQNASVKITDVSQEEQVLADLSKVRVQDLTAQSMHSKIDVTGRTQASRRVFLRAETDGKISSILTDKGKFVKKGQKLAKLEILDRGARVLESQQLLNQREIQYKAAKELSEKGFGSRVRLAEAKAQLETARAKLKRDRVELSHININSPFDGIINNQMIEVGDYVSRGSDLFDIVDLNPIEVVGFLTEKQMEYVVEGMNVSVELLHGKEVEGKVTFISAAADSETRTFEVEITLSNENYIIKEGLTAKIKIPVMEANAYKISPSILSLADDGSIGIKIVNADNIVEFKPVRLLKDTPEFLWIGGLPESIRIITVGQEFVMSGQEVIPVISER